MHQRQQVALQKNLQSRYISYLTAGEEVHHAHIHILPQQNEERKGFRFGDVLQMSKEEIQQIASNTVDILK